MRKNIFLAMIVMVCVSRSAVAQNQPKPQQPATHPAKPDKIAFDAFNASVADADKDRASRLARAVDAYRAGLTAAENKIEREGKDIDEVTRIDKELERLNGAKYEGGADPPQDSGAKIARASFDTARTAIDGRRAEKVGIAKAKCVQALEKARGDAMRAGDKAEAKRVDGLIKSFQKNGVVPPKETFPITVVSGSWKVVGDELIQSSLDGDAMIEFGDPDWKDYDLELEAMPVEGKEGFYVLFGVLTQTEWSCINMGGRGNHFCDRTAFYDGRWGGETQDAPSDPRCKSGIKLGRWYSVKIEVRGEKSTVFVDGEQWFKSEDARFTHGSVGLRTTSTAAKFRKITVRSADKGATLLDGVPDVQPKP